MNLLHFDISEFDSPDEKGSGKIYARIHLTNA